MALEMQAELFSIRLIDRIYLIHILLVPGQTPEVLIGNKLSRAHPINAGSRHRHLGRDQLIVRSIALEIKHG